jgi:hypothetical protein
MTLLSRTSPAGSSTSRSRRDHYLRGMVRWLGALLAAAVMSVFAVLLLTGDYVREGPVLVQLSTTHGIHRGDVGIVSLWTLGMLSLLAVVVAGRPRR